MSERSIQVREFEEQDRAAVARLWTEVFGYRSPRHDPDLVIDRRLAHSRTLFYVAESRPAEAIAESSPAEGARRGELLGTLMAGYDGHRGWIYLLAVRADRRRTGVGRKLIGRAEAELLKLGCLKINLQVLPGNASAVRFYESLGYRVEPRISMARTLCGTDPEPGSTPGK